MKFYCIFEDPDDSVQALKESCEQRGLDFVKLSPTSFDYSKPFNAEVGDLLYRVMIGKAARTLEQVTVNEKITTFHKNYQRAMASYSNVYIYQKHNIPHPKTIPLLTNDRDLLKSFVESLGGFPVIIKALGGSHGVGVMKIDSLSSLFSVTDYLLKSPGEYVLKAFIDTNTSARLIVLGGEVVSSIRYTSHHKDDFRSNVGDILDYQAEDFGQDIEASAVAAVQALDIEFGGVDILIDEATDNHYVAEVNFPCFFPRAQQETGVDISGMMIDYLVQKARLRSPDHE